MIGRAGGGGRPLPSGVERLAGLMASGLGAAMTLAVIAYTLNMPRAFGLGLFTEQFLAFLLGLGLAVAFLAKPAFRGRLVALDILAAALALGAALYVAARYPVLVNELVYKPLDGLLISLVLGLLTIEAIRRLTGPGLTLVVVGFVNYGLAGHLLPFGMSRQILWDRLAIYVVMDTNGMLGLPLMVASIVVYAFIFLGQVLTASGGSAFFNDLALALVGRSRGGAAKIAVVSSFLFGSVSGSAVANVVASGVVTLPLMRRAGYRPQTAAAIEALASTGGQLAPPVMGAAAFLMAEFLQVSYAEVVLAAIIPSFLYYFAIFFFVDVHAAANRLTLPKDVDVLPLGQVLRGGWQFILPFVVLIGSLFGLHWRPELAALAAAGTLAALALVVPYRGRRCSPGALLRTLPDTGRAVVEIIAISAGAGMVIGVLNISGLSFSMTLALVDLAANNLFLLLIVAALVSVVLGMGMPTVGVYVLLASLIGPALTRAGIDPIAAHMFLLYFGMLSMITPPVALASFTAAAMVHAAPMRTGFEAVRIGWVAYLIPFIIVIEPGLVMQADPVTTLWNFAGAVAGVCFATGAIAGYLGGALRPRHRLILAVAAVVAILPLQGLLGVDYIVNIAAAGLGIAVIWWRGARPVA